MNKTLVKGLIIVSIASLFYLFMFFVRVLPTIMVDDLQRDLGITAKGIGLITSSFVIPYALVQIPSGIIIDRVGVKKIMVLGMVGSMIGCLMFQYSTSYILPTFARALIGVSCGAAFIAPMTLVKQWLPEKMFSTAAGMIQLLGCVGAMLSIPLSHLVSDIGWRDTFTFSAIIAASLAIIFMIMIKERHEESLSEDSNILSSLKVIFGDKRYWCIGIIAMTSWAILGGFSESFGINFLSTLQGISIPEATTQMSWVWIGVAVASPLSGYWYEHAHNKRLPLILLLTMSLASFLVLLLGLTQNSLLIQGLLFLSGFSAGAQPIAFGLVAHISAENTMATAVSFCNTCVIAGAFILQPLVSLLVDASMLSRYVDSTQTTELTNFLLVDYQIGFTPIVVVVILGLIISIQAKWN